MAEITSEVLIERLAEWGVDTVFGLPGDGINGHHGGPAPARRPGPVRPRAPRGGGGVHGHRVRQGDRPDRGVPGDLRARAASTWPTACTTRSSTTCRCWRSPGCRRPSVLGTGYQQEVAPGPAVRGRRRVQPGRDEPGADAGAGRHGDPHRVRAPRGRPSDASRTTSRSRRRARTRTRRWRRCGRPSTAPVYLAAGGAARATPTCGPRPRCSTPAARSPSWPVSARAAPGSWSSGSPTMLGAPIVKSLLGKMVVPDDSPYTTGGLGLLGTKPSEELMEDVDTLLMLGTNFPYTKFLPEPGKVRVVQVEIEPARAGTRIPTDVPLVGDVGGHPGGAAAAARAQGPRAPGEIPGEGPRLARGDDRALESAGPGPDRPAVPGPSARRAGRRRRGARPATRARSPPGRPGTGTIRGGREFYLSGHARHDGARPPVRARRSSTPSRAGRSSRTWATGVSRC